MTAIEQKVSMKKTVYFNSTFLKQTQLSHKTDIPNPDLTSINNSFNNLLSKICTTI